MAGDAGGHRAGREGPPVPLLLLAGDGLGVGEGQLPQGARHTERGGVLQWGGRGCPDQTKQLTWGYFLLTTVG